MTRKRIRHEQITIESKRNTIFKKRTDGLLKKANELSVLCGVEMAIVVHKEYENNIILWPSPAVFGERLRKFLDFPDLERKRKMATNDQVMEQMVNGERESLLKSQKRNELKECQQLMNELFMQGRVFVELDVHQLNALSSFADEMVEINLRKRDQQFGTNEAYNF